MMRDNGSMANEDAKERSQLDRLRQSMRKDFTAQDDSQSPVPRMPKHLMMK